jgi:anti-sigma B factor antagonist
MSETPSPAIEVEHLSSAVVARIMLPDLDETHIGRVREQLAPLVAQSGMMPFILDMSRVKFVPSLTLGMLVKLFQEFKSRGQRLILVSLQPTVRQVFAITRLDRLFEILPDVQSATKTLGPAAQ